jgi:predicted nucleic acid-binding protein
VKPARTVVLDNEAVQALADPDHTKHRRVLATVEAAASRNLRRAGSVSLVVPAAVQVEAGWDRKQPRTAALNRLRADRPSLAGAVADAAADVVSTLGVSVADAHLAATLASTPGPHAVVTSDEPDVRRGADRVGVSIIVVKV